MEFNIKITYNDGTIFYNRSFYFDMNKDFFEFSSCEDGICYSINLDDIIQITISYHMDNTDFIVYQYFN